MSRKTENKFTRLRNGFWVIATPLRNGHQENSMIWVQVKDGDDVYMATGSFVKIKTFRDGTSWNLYEIDKARGGKAPTSGRLGKDGTDTNLNRDGTDTKDDGDVGTFVGTDGLDDEIDDETIGETIARKEDETIESKTGTDTQVAEALHDLIARLKTYAKIEYVDGKIKVIEEVLETLKETSHVTIDIRKADQQELKCLEGYSHKVTAEVLACLSVGVHIYLVGPAGSGKTHLGTTVADALDRTLYICGAMLTKHEVTGFMNVSGYQTTAARQAYEFGGILLWDEVDASMPAALVAVNAMLSNGEYTFPDKTVKRHDDFVCLAAGNTFGKGGDREYVARLQLDAATLDRFGFIEMGYDLGLERALANAEFKAFGGTDDAVISAWLDKVIQVRDKVAESHIRHVVSPRASINGAKLLARGMPVQTVVRILLHKGLDDDTARQIGVA